MPRGVGTLMLEPASPRRSPAPARIASATGRAESGVPALVRGLGQQPDRIASAEAVRPPRRKNRVRRGPTTIARLRLYRLRRTVAGAPVTTAPAVGAGPAWVESWAYSTRSNGSHNEYRGLSPYSWYPCRDRQVLERCGRPARPAARAEPVCATVGSPNGWGTPGVAGQKRNRKPAPTSPPPTGRKRRPVRAPGRSTVAVT